VEAAPISDERRWRPFVLGELYRSQVSEQLLTMISKRVCLTLESTLESVDVAERTATSTATQIGFSEDQVYQVSMAVREAMVNAVLHGNRYDPQKRVELTLERSDRNLVVSVRDQGEGLDVQKIPDPLAPENLLKQSGRGIFLMRAFMDEVQVNSSSSGTEIILIKNLGGDAVEPKEKAQ
jgi:serine/threonine-protein kinase RsbW